MGDIEPVVVVIVDDHGLFSRGLELLLSAASEGRIKVAGRTESAEEAGIPLPHLRLLRTVAPAHAAATGKRLPINGAGVAGAAFADLGFPPAVVRGFALLARTAGIVGHLAEEMTEPIGRQLWLDVEHRVTYTADPQ